MSWDFSACRSNEEPFFVAKVIWALMMIGSLFLYDLWLWHSY